MLKLRHLFGRNGILEPGFICADSNKSGVIGPVSFTEPLLPAEAGVCLLFLAEEVSTPLAEEPEMGLEDIFLAGDYCSFSIPAHKPSIASRRITKCKSRQCLRG